VPWGQFFKRRLGANFARLGANFARLGANFARLGANWADCHCCVGTYEHAFLVGANFALKNWLLAYVV
jgi:hypothetical protein